MKNKVGRNDPCPCGSGKKYKKCCLDKDVYANTAGFTEDLSPPADTGSSSDTKVSDVAQSVPELVAELKKFDLTTSVAIVSGMMIDPIYHPNTCRLEVLV